MPVAGYSPISAYGADMAELLASAEAGAGKFGRVREGWVFKSLDGNDQFKVISNKWLAATGK